MAQAFNNQDKKKANSNPKPKRRTGNNYNDALGKINEDEIPKAEPLTTETPETETGIHETVNDENGTDTPEINGDETGTPEIPQDQTPNTDNQVTVTDTPIVPNVNTENSTETVPIDNQLVERFQAIITESLPTQERGKNISVYLTNEAFTLLQNYCKKHKIKNRSTVIDTIIKNVLK